MIKPTIALAFGGGHVAPWQAAALGAYNRAREAGYEVIAFNGGFKGGNEGSYFVVSPEHLDRTRAGIPYGSSRAEVDPRKVADNLVKIKRDGYDVKGVIGLCGDDHLKQTNRLQTEEGIPVMGWPKTMDNDLSHTYFTLGYHTTAMNAARAVRQGINGAITNGRIHIITMFGRDTDWVVAAAGGFGGASITVGGELESNQTYVTKYRLDYIIDLANQEFKENESRYGRPFAVVAVGESAAIEGLASHVDLGQVDDHGHPKIKPEKLALALGNAFKEAGIKDVSTDTLTYDTLRNCAPSQLDMELGEEAGAMCAEKLIEGESGQSVVTVRDPDSKRGVRLDTAPLDKVFVQRFLRPEGFMDYDRLKVDPRFIDYYEPVLGKATTIEDLIPKMELRTV
jgi:ATP-dependent phosphofructokinase / diphosphate-dependent phosphofructokinase